MGGILEVRDVHKRFGDLAVLRGVSLSLEPGEMVALIGPSGSGKSTLIRCVNGLEPLDQGQILVQGQPIHGRDAATRATRRRVGTVFQHFNVFPHMTTLENLTNPLRVVRRMPRQEAERVARTMLAAIHMDDKLDVYPAKLSVGQKQRVAIARALAMEPQLMLFDEPTSALDPELAHEVLFAIQDLAQRGMAMIVATHQVNFIGRFADRVIFIDEGVIKVEGSADYVLQHAKEPRLVRFLQEVREAT